MNLPTTVPQHSSLEAQPQAPANPAPRPFYWSVRRELWENRSLYIAPLAITALVLFACSISALYRPGGVRSQASGLEVEHRHSAAQGHTQVDSRRPIRPPAASEYPYGSGVSSFTVILAPIMLATFLVGLYYSLDALYGERRDRSFLFWKSLPVSDRTTVLSKAAIPLVVLPAIAYALCMATFVVIVFVNTVLLWGGGTNPWRFLAEVRPFKEPVVVLYLLAVHSLWFARIYAWLLLISAWARRTPLLWAALPFVAIPLVERIAFQTSYFGDLLMYRVDGALMEAFGAPSQAPILFRLSKYSPMSFLTSSGLWLGLAVAAICLEAAARVRRDRPPI